ncbi:MULTISPECIES: CmcJ/NvfI family oxidoreductase [unclassified Vibrio]|uniref:CmcJ/NvfI family oxidoreductase n=1 Tax=Vibrio sp. HB236076 TaxID=3232307 RepID=A0AB39HFV4_9VIBR|nr:CmcJ/NvfI family oxidoreductase [Vibrio sp. HB161653]MDP5255280.1 CmcJ/NvfI family oxidoreductase [Vibrio sp. HB161653]
MNVKANVNYHVVKPFRQAFYFDVEGVEGQLITPELASVEVDVEDLRETEQVTDFLRHGVTFVNAPSVIKDFTQPGWQALYEQELTELAQRFTGAKDVLVFDHTLRVDDPDASRRPARNVHNDYSEQAIAQRLEDLVGREKAKQYEQGHFGFINVWRPVDNSIMSSPLGFICPYSMHQEDWMTIDLIYPDRQGEILGVAANPDHHWFYLSKMRPEEAVIFNVYDNQGLPYVAHSALERQEAGDDHPPRKSLESRLLVRY